MSASFSPTGKPVWAVTTWVDDSYVYIEMPCMDGPPLIQKYAFSEAGLSKALGMMRDLHRKLAPKGGYHKLEPHPLTKVIVKGRRKPVESTEAQRALIHQLLKARGII